ncbi:SH3 domain-containing protein [Bacillus sp. B15-48]|uniref:SH3 domain-containing protein n=1 Tax=Bacillus sp. B15-48 TaxID=1548601 RepID=UPI00194014BA|nr:SH3 domain-containing protein [Bacillus sp. B15-48]MBM4762400.1 SH3 domain-containing protein [Bacillus sp. B15-48]
MRLKNFPVVPLLILLIFGSIYPGLFVKANNQTLTITATNLNVREGPGLDSPVVAKVQKGEHYSIIQKKDNWIQITLSNGNVGWVSNEFTAADKQHKKTFQAFATDKLNVRSTPSLNGSIIGQLTKGEQVTVRMKENDWALIHFDGKEAWVNSQYLTTTLSPRAVQRVPSGQATVTATTLNVRDQNSLNGKVIGSITKGETFPVLEEHDNWLKIEFKPGITGWAASWFFQTAEQQPSTATIKDQFVTVLNDGTNIRNDAGTNGQVIRRANKGETFEVIERKNDWYKIRFKDGSSGFIAGWIVSVNGNTDQIIRSGTGNDKKNKVIVIDPGHGGKDVGAIGTRGTFEKTVTLQTAKLLSEKLRASGAEVYLTRNSDTYLPLASRIAISEQKNADAFISIHYDSHFDPTVRGITSYYYHDNQLAKNLHSAVTTRTRLTDRGVRFGDYYVIRENKQNSVLIELGYLSNPTEELLITSNQYQQAVATGLFEGLATYFSNKETE